MPILKREDGTQFVTQAYREVLGRKSPSILKREIYNLAKKNGEQVCLFERSDGQFEAVFSRDPGYLLGDAVWFYFKKPKYLILCEELPSSPTAKQVLVVIIKDGSVYSVNAVAYENLDSELAFVATSTDRYDVYVYGDVPMQLDEAHTASFKKLEESVYNKLVLNKSLQLQPVEMALEIPYFKSKAAKFLVIGIIAVLGIAVWYFMVPSPPPPTSEGIAKKKSQEEPPFEAYYKALQTAAPQRICAEMIGVIGKFIIMPGWAVNSINYQNGQYTIQVVSTAGKYEQLQQWAQEHGIAGLSGNDSTATFILASKVPVREMPSFIYNAGTVVKLIKTRLERIIEKGNIFVGNATPSGKTSSVAMVIEFKDSSPAIFSFIGEKLSPFPVEVTQIEISMTQQLLTGKIKLNVWGN
jgi:hypothetical protein